MSQPRILVVDDNPNVCAFTARSLERFGYSVAGKAATGRDAITLAEATNPDLVLMDINLDGEMDGIETGRRMRFEKDLPVVYITGNADDETLARAMATEPVGYIVKPFEPEDLHASIETALCQYKAKLKQKVVALSDSEELSLILEAVPAGILVIDSGTHLIRYANQEAARIYGAPKNQIIGSVCHHVVCLANQGRCPITDLGQTIDRSERVLLTANGEELPILKTVTPMKFGANQYLLEVFVDIAERKKAQEQRDLMEIQLRQALKLEAVGQLAAGIAHEINTPTQYVGDNTRFLQDAFGDLLKALQNYGHLLDACRQGPPPPDLTREVETAVSEADLDYLKEEIPKAISQSLEGVSRVSTIVRAMKEFSHPGGDEKQSIDLNHAIQSTITVCRNEWKYVAEMVTNFDANLPMVPCLPGELNQVILNLIINSAHAIADVVGKKEGGEKGIIKIVTQAAGDWAEIRISDTGTGIAPEARSKIFTPFFTTKEVGKGTGQGLAISRTVIVGKHGGSIDFETEVGKGTTFIVRLPLGAKGT
jgi:two-component system, NtrC family, sensor kinase